MICRGCGKECSDEFVYCPSCGIKLIKGKAKTLPKVYQALPVYSDKQLELLADVMSHQENGKYIRALLLEEDAVPVKVYEIVAEVYINWMKDRSPWWRKEEMHTRASFLNAAKKGVIYDNVRFSIRETEFAISHYPYCGRLIFRSRDEAEHAIEQVGYKVHE